MSQIHEMESLLDYLDGDPKGTLENNPEPRCPCVLLLDTSASMKGESIRELKSGVNTLREELSGDKLASLRVELACVTFGGNVEVAHEFTHPHDFEAPELRADGRTPMGKAVHSALDLIEARREAYREHDLDDFKSWALLITDGEPTDAEDVMSSAAQRVRQGERDDWLAFFAIGVERANMDKLAELTVRSPRKLKGLKFPELFRWVSDSLRQVSRSRPGDSVELSDPVASGWAEV